MRSIVGTWKLVGAAARDRNGNTLPDPYGGKPMGRVVFTAEGRMMAVTCDGRPDLPSGTRREYSSYIGTYNFDGVAARHTGRRRLGPLPHRQRPGARRALRGRAGGPLAAAAPDRCRRTVPRADLGKAVH